MSPPLIPNRSPVRTGVLAAAVGLACAGLSACATSFLPVALRTQVEGGAAAVPATPAPGQTAPARWAAPQAGEAAWPHEGRLTSLLEWWRQQSDPVMAKAIAAAQSVSPTVSSALARRAQAQADRVATGAALGPQLDGTGSAQRRSASPPFPAGDTFQGGLQGSWELDLAGGGSALRAASVWRASAADAQWHEARVSVAADVALQVLSWRHCRAVQQRTQAEADSSTRSARWAEQLGAAGLQSAAQVAAARSAAADARNRARSQDQRCAAETQALAQWTGWPSTEVQQRLQAGSQSLTLAAPQWDQGLPAQVLAQRPDVFAAASAVASAAADVGTAAAARYPRVAISGFLGRTQLRTDDFRTSLNSWTIGPLSVSLPLWDGGRRAAQETAAQARYADAVMQHQAVVRRAVRETEDALQALASSAAQAADVQALREAAATIRDHTRRLADSGLASAAEAEEAQRRFLAADLAWLQWQRERAGAWIALYRAAGGGWSPANHNPIAKDTP